MSFITNISTVARYEARTLRRSWFFRLFSIGALFIFTFMNIGVFSPIGEEDWDSISIPSTLPLINLYLLNIGQAIVVIFLAADFLKRDKKLDTNEVLYTRSMSNLEYVLGKTWGILRLFLGLDIVILSIGLLMNIISTKMTVDISSYLAYLLIIAVPTILFSLGLAFLMMSVIRNQALTFLLLLGIAVLDMFYLWFRMGSLFDYMAFGLPVFKSGMVGFDNINLIFNQRFMYFSAGAALVFGTVLLFKRLPQSKIHTAIAGILLLIFTALAGVCGWNTYSIYNKGVRTRETVIETNKIYEDKKFADITKAFIDLEHKGDKIHASAKIAIKNTYPDVIESYIFSLNPDLKVISAKTLSENSSFTSTNHVIEIKPWKPLQPGGTDTVMIEYEGGINEPFCYPDYSDNIKENPYRIAMVNISKRQAFLTPGYVLLTPDTHWYPVASLNYYPSNPARLKIDFSEYTLKVKNEPGLTAISQGHRVDSAGYSVFSPGNPVPGITLAIGNYTSDTLKVDSVEYFTYYFPGHDYYKKDLREINDTLGRMVSGIMRELETNFSTPFPFKTLSLVEVPVQFYSYPRQNTQTRAEVQPSMVLLPEKLSTLRNAGFAKRFQQQKKQMARNNQVITDKELQVRIFNSFIRNTFISGEDFRFVNGRAVNEPVRYRLGPSFYFFKNNFYSSDYPVINAVFESHLQKVARPDQGFSMSDALTENDRANLILKDVSFSDLLRKNPLGDTIRTVVTIKGDWLFNLLRSRAGTEQFNEWFRKYLNDYKFKKVDLKSFDEDVNNKFGFGFYPLLENWFNGKDQPGFIVNDLRSSEIVINDRSRYQVTFAISNPEPVAGLFNVSFRSSQGPQTSISYGERGGFTVATQGRGMETPDISKIVYLGAMEAKKVGVLLDYQPRAMTINTLYSRNIPGQINMPINDIIKAKSYVKPFEGEELLSSMPRTNDPSELIVDNEDPGFDSGEKSDQGPLKKLFHINKRAAREYETIRYFYVPETWQPIVQSNYYGKYILSAVYTRPTKTAERVITWSAPIDKPGYYDIYTYVGKSLDNVTIRRGGPEGMPPPPGSTGEESPYRDMHYRIYHDQGVEEITIDYDNAEGGWNNMGRYYISGDTAKIELTSQSQGKVVIGDAVKWVKQE
ncbi:MAG TPA: hypothetical protein VK207_06025 [Bacteroidales bacterium]|nr:hypothetical protein [Bacteroidales bacterium]